MGKMKQLVKSVNRDNLSLFVSKIKKDGFRKTFRDMNTYLGHSADMEASATDSNIIELVEPTAPLHIPSSESPKVSIVIPVYNHYKETYNCIKSIIDNTPSCTYEVIIGDDCSTDDTLSIKEQISNIVVNRNEHNLGFTLNCNAAAKLARGEYVLFLNNDTIVTENWLEALVKLIESDPKIGMVGSKLVYPNGMLQEAGGIVWSDASAWNYGNCQNPNLPQFNYVKEVDYISGAAIMIRRTLFEEIGGFDARYAPAYYEDSDLAFEVRKRGYKLMYQPKSVVYHFEGISNGKKVTEGLKTYQVTNLAKFQEKWKDVLEAEHKPNAVDVFHARDRSFGKRTIIVMDNCLPEYDKDAGSRTIYQYIQIFKDMGLNIKFMGLNFFPLQPYTDELEQMGIEVLAGPWFRDNWKNWILENKDSIDFVFINRPHVAEVFLPFFKENTDCKIIYNLCDLHFLRETREAELTGNSKLMRAAQETKTKELKLMGDADVSLTLSTYEKQVLDEYLPPEKIKIAPIFIYDTFEMRAPGNTENLMFVGGFRHTPNIDAVMWFCKEVFPLIKKDLPDVKFYICGSKPTDEINALASDDIIVTGYLTDEELDNMYKQCRVCVIPLRYGAGVKGKTIEAMHNGIPIVTTSVGIEGLPNIEDCVTPRDSAEDFAEEVIRCYNSDCSEQTSACLQYVKDHFSYDYSKEFFSGLIDDE